MQETENRLTQGETVSEEFRGSESNDTPPTPPTPPTHPSSKSNSSSPAPMAPFIPTSKETLVEQVVSKYLTSIVDDTTIQLGGIRDALLRRINGVIALENTGRKDSFSSSPPLVKSQSLDEVTVAQVLLSRNCIVAVDLSEGQADDMTLLAMYVEYGEDMGTYTTSEARIKALASELKPSMTKNAIDSLYGRLRIHAPQVSRTTEPHLIPVANGVFDHDQQVLLPFSRDWVFLSKIPTAYKADAKDPVITMPDKKLWTFDSWIASLSDDDGVPELLWEVISAAVRSYAPWDTAIWFAAERGNNGKGTLVQMLRNLLGSKACSAVKFADFGHEFKMEALVHARVNLVDENDVGEFFDHIADWKAAITGDVFTLNRKYKTPVAVRFLGIDIQCFNSSTPRTKDKSDSFYRRLLIVKFNKWFGGAERQYIKRDYLGRPEVLEYVLKRALEMQHTKLSNPQACQEAMDDYRGNNNLLLSFWEEFEQQLAWGLVPFGFLHALYSEWFRRTNPSGKPESRNALVAFLREHLASSAEWEHKGSDDVRPKQLMNSPEVLSVEYGLVDWMNSSYTGTDPLKKSTLSPLKVNYKGLVRRHQIALPGSAATEEEEDSTD